jgi:hypothetical protein
MLWCVQSRPTHPGEPDIRSSCPAGARPTGARRLPKRRRQPPKRRPLPRPSAPPPRARVPRKKPSAPRPPNNAPGRPSASSHGCGRKRRAIERPRPLLRAAPVPPDPAARTPVGRTGGNPKLAGVLTGVLTSRSTRRRSAMMSFHGDRRLKAKGPKGQRAEGQGPRKTSSALGPRPFTDRSSGPGAACYPPPTPPGRGTRGQGRPERAAP